MSEQNDTFLINKFKVGDLDAANELIDRYFNRVVAAARKRLRNANLRVTTDEDVAVSVFESLWKKVENNKFGDSDLASTAEFWRLICVMVRNKACDHQRREFAERRGGGEVKGESAFIKPGSTPSTGIENCIFDNVSAADRAEFRDYYTFLMQKLDNDEFREIVTLRLEGFSNREIADKFGRCERWAQRKLVIIRETWSQAEANQVEQEHKRPSDE